MRFGDGDARMRWTWILKFGSDGLTELRKLECRLQERISCGKAEDAPTERGCNPNQIGRVEEPMKIAPALGIGGTIAGV